MSGNVVTQEKVGVVEDVTAQEVSYSNISMDAEVHGSHGPRYSEGIVDNDERLELCGMLASPREMQHASNPLNRKVGKRSRQPKDGGARKRHRRRESVWNYSSPKMENGAPRERARETSRISTIGSDDLQLVPESNIDMAKFLRMRINSTMRVHAQESIPPIVEYLTKMFATLELMSIQTTWARVLQVLFIHMSPILDRKHLNAVLRTFSILTGFPGLVPEGGLEFESTEETQILEDELTCSWTKLLKDLKGNWKGIQMHPLFSNFSKLLSIMVYAGYLEFMQETWQDEVLKSLFPGSQSACKSAAGVFEASVDILDYVTRALSVWQETGDPIAAFADAEHEGLASSIAKAKANHSHFGFGTLVEQCGKTNEDHQEDVLRLLVVLKRHLNGSLSPQLRNYYQRELVDFEHMRSEISNRLTRTPMRVEPFSVYLNGSPGQGKSNLCSLLARVCHNAIGVEFDQRKVYDRITADAYWSQYTSDVTCITVNDVGASTSKDVCERQYEEILRVIDSARLHPPMPEAHQKGQVDINAFLVLMSGNGVCPNAGNCLNNLQALARRVRLCPVVVAKPEFCDRDSSGNYVLSARKVAEAHVNGTLNKDDDFDEVQDIYLYEARAEGKSIQSVPYEVDGKHKLTVKEFMIYVGHQCKLHYEAELEKLRMFKDKDLSTFELPSHNLATAKKIYLTSSPSLDVVESINDSRGGDPSRVANRQRSGRRNKREQQPYDMDYAAWEAAEQERFAEWAESVAGLVPEANVRDMYNSVVTAVATVTSGDVYYLARSHAQFLDRFGWFPRLRIPYSMLPPLIWYFITPRLRTQVNRHCINCFLMTAVIIITMFSVPIGFVAGRTTSAVLSGILMCISGMFFVQVAHNLHESAMTPFERLRAIGAWRRINMYRVGGVALLIVSACATIKFSLTLRPYFSGHLSAEKVEEIKPAVKKDVKIVAASEESEMVAESAAIETNFSMLDDPAYRAKVGTIWNKSREFLDRSHLQPCAHNTIHATLAPIVARNMFSGMLYKDKVHIGDIQALVVCCGYLVIPKHYIQVLERHVAASSHVPDFKAILRSAPAAESTHAFSVTIDVGYVYKVPNADLAIILCNATGPRKDLTKHLPTKRTAAGGPAVHLTRACDGELTSTHVHVGATEVVSVKGVDDYIGRYYTRDEGHEYGLCGATLISRGARAHIMGIHTAGSQSQDKMCVASVLLKSDVDDAIAFFTRVCPHAVNLLPECSVDLTERIVGFKMAEPHYKSPVRFTTNDAQFSFLGTIPTSMTFSSDVRPTLISNLVEQVCGVDANDYVPPVSKPSYFGPQKGLDALATPSRAFPDRAIVWAMEDYMKPLMERASESKHVFRMLTTHEIWNGTSVPFEDHVNWQSSWGFPLSGSKLNTRVEIPNDDPGAPASFTVTQPVLDLLEEVETEYGAGRIMRSVATSCIKDEVHFQKESARVFEVAGFPTTAYGRKLTLKILSFLRLNSTISEAFVGIDCHGPDSTLYHAYATRFGTDRLVLGDFSKFDKRNSAALLTCAMEVFRRMISSFFPEEERDHALRAFSAWSHDVIYAHVNCFGDLIQLNAGGFPSGVCVTTEVNCIVNSLIHRCVYFCEYEKRHGSASGIPPFRSMVSLSTYGDDSASSVNIECDWFNMAIMALWCDTFGIKYTAPDKSSNIPKFWPYKDFDFLKRSFTRVHESGHMIGRLVVSSIYKPLCKVVWTTNHVNSQEEMAIEVVRGSMLEAFNHGKEFYDNHRDQMRKIMTHHGLITSCSFLEETFESRLESWHTSHDGKLEMFKQL